MEEIPSSDSLVRLTEAVIFEKLVGCGLCRVKRSYASVIKEDGLRKELILKGWWARVVICESEGPL